ncbi:S-type pyocin domain-containing protein [Halomonas sp. V046]|uniref:S-type pyocin domain-containing protein n=1 Tax=Halomonas sp. V046 TaxID=3459611 RepID=UPI00404410E8
MQPVVSIWRVAQQYRWLRLVSAQCQSSGNLGTDLQTHGSWRRPRITAEGLRGMSSAKARLGFWVSDTDKGVEARGIYIESGSEYEQVPVAHAAHAQWVGGNGQSMEMVVNGVTLTWTPSNGPQQTTLPIEPDARANQITVYPNPGIYPWKRGVDPDGEA